MEAYRTYRGNLVPLSEMTATALKNSPSLVFEQANSGPVVIMRHKKPAGVFLSYPEFEALIRSRRSSLASLENEFDQMLSHMQTEEAKEGLSAAFAASSVELGQAALAAARNG